MTKDEIISRQVIQIAELTEQLAALKEDVSHVRKLCFCIGGPLNDNMLKYNSAQLLIFQRIVDILE